MRFLPALRRLLFLAMLATAPSLFAHPHMSLTARCEFVWKGDTLSGVYFDWAFDPYFSADIIRGYDSNKDGKFDAEETKAVYDNAFQNLKNYYYFTFIRQGSSRTNPKTVKDFSVYQKSGTLHYRFFIDLSAYKGELSIAIYDYTYFCAVDYAKENPVTFDCDETRVKPHAEIVENKKYPVYYNPTGAIDDTTIYYTWQKGLLTFYPREIVLRYGPAKD
ncbi:MAG: DUF1007 family protein [Rectinema sp.]|jgi:ABC-type uncharacterized transport system substrate-binding protein